MPRRRPLYKYWAQRHSLFHRFDEGIQLDDESWFSVTPEGIAAHHAQRVADAGARVVLDAFCGAGGNSIQFASKVDLVFAVDIDPHKIALARHNAGIYGVAHKIEFICADIEQLLAAGCLPAVDVVFLSPPWGGPTYRKAIYCSLRSFTVDLWRLLELARARTHNVMLFLPRNLDLGEVQDLLGAESRFELELNNINGKLKAITVYAGALVGESEG